MYQIAPGRVWTDGTRILEVKSHMGAALAILLLALLLGGVGLFVEALRWLLIIALVLFVLSAFTGWRGRRVV